MACRCLPLTLLGVFACHAVAAEVISLPPGVTRGPVKLSSGDALRGAADGSSVVDVSVTLDDWEDLGGGVWGHAVERLPSWVRQEAPLRVDGVLTPPTAADRFLPVTGVAGPRTHLLGADPPRGVGAGRAEIYLRRGNTVVMADFTCAGRRITYGDEVGEGRLTANDVVRLSHPDFLDVGEWCHVAADRVAMRTDGPAPVGVTRMRGDEPAVRIHGDSERPVTDVVVERVATRGGVHGFGIRHAAGITLREVAAEEGSRGIHITDAADVTVDGATIRAQRIGVTVGRGTAEIRLRRLDVAASEADGVIVGGTQGFSLTDSRIAGAQRFAHPDCLQQIAIVSRGDEPGRRFFIANNVFIDSGQGLIFETAEDVVITGNTFGPRIGGQCLIVKGGARKPNRRFTVVGNRFLGPGLSPINFEPDPEIGVTVTHNSFYMVRRGGIRGPANTLETGNVFTFPAGRERPRTRVLGEGVAATPIDPGDLPVAVGRIDLVRAAMTPDGVLPLHAWASTVRVGDVITIDGYAGRYAITAFEDDIATLDPPLPRPLTSRGAVWAWP